MVLNPVTALQGEGRYRFTNTLSAFKSECRECGETHSFNVIKLGERTAHLRWLEYMEKHNKKHKNS